MATSGNKVVTYKIKLSEEHALLVEMLAEQLYTKPQDWLSTFLQEQFDGPEWQPGIRRALKRDAKVKGKSVKRTGRNKNRRGSETPLETFRSYREYERFVKRGGELF